MARQFGPRTIAGRLAGWFLLIALVPSIVLVVIMFLILRRGIEEDVKTQLTLILNSRVEQLKTYINERQRETLVTARAPSILGALSDLAGIESPASAVRSSTLTPAERIRLVVTEFCETLGYPNAMVLNPRGEVIYQQRSAFELKEALNAGPMKDTELGKMVAQVIARREPAASVPEKYPQLRETQEVIFVAAPVIAEDKLIGVFVAQLIPEELDRIFSSYEGLSETGEIYAGRIIGRNAVIVTPLRNDLNGTYQNRAYPIGGPTAVALQRSVQGQGSSSGTATGYGLTPDYRGVTCVSAWTHVPVINVGVVAGMDEDDAFRLIYFHRWVSLGLLLLTAVLVTPAALLVARGLSRPVREAAEMSRRVASGDLTAATAGDSREHGEVGQLHRSIRDMTGHLHSLISHIQQSIVTLMATATEIAATSRQQQQTLNEFGSSTYQVASAVNEISATSQELAKTMTEVNTAANRAAEQVVVGQQGLTGMHHTMTRLAESTGSISSRLSVISERASNINLVVTTITKVADQTNLLSINAAIEAEKAGEYGRGFLVVAREIRRLADQTAVATLDIERIVREMQHSVTAGVMEMDKFNEQVRQGVGEVERIGDQLGEVIGGVQQILPRFEQVTEGMAAQSQGAEQIREAVGHLSDGAARTIESLKEFNRATEQLREAVGGLKEDISKFTT